MIDIQIEFLNDARPLRVEKISRVPIVGERLISMPYEVYEVQQVNHILRPAFDQVAAVVLVEVL